MIARSAIAWIAAGTASAAAIGVGDVHPAWATTVPGVLSVSKLVITDDAIRVRVRRNTWRSVVHYPRGAEVRYDVANRGSRAFSLNILGSVTGRIAPGRQAPILVYWARRGRFVFRAAPKGPRVTVFVD